MTQADLVLETLKNGRTFSLLTATHMNIGNPRQVISTLRNRGWNIECYKDVDPTGKEFSAYRLLEQPHRPIAPCRAHAFAN